GLAYADIATAGGLSVSTKGGTSIQVTAGANIFVQTGIAVSLGGVALTNVVVPAGGLTLTGTTGAHPAADAAPVLRITNNGVSKSFAYAAPGASTDSHSFQIAGSTITVAPAFGPSKGANNIVITGSGFSTTAANDAVTVNNVACTAIVGTPTATSITCTVPAMLTPFTGPVRVKVVVTGGTALTSVISAGSTYTYVAQ
ncbi:MAG TPA: IPT/TIG domain-containing protein, partial [Dermatophilaceae bacterium]